MNLRERKKIINNISIIVEERGYSRYTLSKEAGIPYASLTNVFNRGSIPRVDMVLKLCKTLQVSPTMLLTGLSDEKYLEKFREKEEKI